MVTEYNGACNSKIQDIFRSLDIYLFIAIVSLFFSLFIFTLNISDSIFPPYTYIILCIVFIVIILSVVTVKSLKKEVCNNDGFSYILF